MTDFHNAVQGTRVVTKKGETAAAADAATNEGLKSLQKRLSEIESTIAFMQTELQDSAKIYEHLNFRIHEVMLDFKGRLETLRKPLVGLLEDFHARFPKVYHCPKCKAVVNPKSERCRGCGKAL